MGLYDYFGIEGIQLKAGECNMLDYSVGDDVPLADGVYVAYEGLVVIRDGKLLATFPNGQLFNKWGGFIEERAELDTENPIFQAIKEMKDRYT